MTDKQIKVLFKLINLHDEFKKINVKLLIYIIPDRILNIIKDDYNMDKIRYLVEAWGYIPDKYDNFILYSLCLDTINNKFKLYNNNNILSLQWTFNNLSIKNDTLNILQKNFNIDYNDNNKYSSNSMNETEIDIIINKKKKNNKICIIS